MNLTLALPHRNIIGEYLILCVIVKGDSVVSLDILTKISNAVYTFFVGERIYMLLLL